MDYANYLLLFGAGIVAGFINVNAGGGSSLTLPTLILMGLSGPMANGTNRIGIIVQTFSAVVSFRREKFSQFKISLKLALFALPGAIAGALISVRIGDEWFRRILGIIMIGIVISMIFSSKKDNKKKSISHKKQWLIYPAMFGIGFYGGFIQAGVGFLLMAALYHLLHENLIRVNMHKVFIVFIYMLPALAIFIITGNIHWGYGIILAGGMAVGGWFGAKLAVKGGEKVIRVVLIMAILIMAAKLLNIF